MRMARETGRDSEENLPPHTAESVCVVADTYAYAYGRESVCVVADTYAYAYGRESARSLNPDSEENLSRMYGPMWRHTLPDAPYR